MKERELKNIQHNTLARWTTERSRDLYGIRNWGAGYFDIAENGNVVVRSKTSSGEKLEIGLIDVIKGAKDRGFDMPILIRIENLLDSQISLIHKSFNDAIKKFGYTGKYRGVYPIKVNQQQPVIEEIIRFGSRYHHGLEAGSKAELIAAISMFQDTEACLICNGYKDEEFIDLVLYVTKLGYKCFFVIEMFSELKQILRRAQALNIMPRLGVRLKLSVKAGGHWASSGGDRSLFGLNMNEIIQVVDLLKQKKMIACLQLVHYHLGSQIPNIRDIRTGVAEASRIYSELVLEGAPMGYLNIGGGLAVDYDGSQTNFPSSRNYQLKEYCEDIIEIIQSMLDENNIPHPTIITESGRATVAYYSILVFNILETIHFEAPKVPETIPQTSHEMLHNLKYVYNTMTLKNIQECYNDALYYKDEIHKLFQVGQINLRQRATADIIFWNIIQQIAINTRKLKRLPQELINIESAIADIYYGNFSLFQSLPDSWAIEHLFPIMPIHRLETPPNRNAVFGDITCDSDGKIERFIDQHDVRHSLPVHEIKKGDEYYIGAFLVGAYQETLGDLHNLLGDTNIVNIRINSDSSFDFVKELEGDTISEVLSYVEYDVRALRDQFRAKAEKAVKGGKISVKERREILAAYENGLRGYTYFER